MTQRISLFHRRGFRFPFDPLGVAGLALLAAIFLVMGATTAVAKQHQGTPFAVFDGPDIVASIGTPAVDFSQGCDITLDATVLGSTSPPSITQDIAAAKYGYDDKAGPTIRAVQAMALTEPAKYGATDSPPAICGTTVSSLLLMQIDDATGPYSAATGQEITAALMDDGIESRGSASTTMVLGAIHQAEMTSSGFETMVVGAADVTTCGACHGAAPPNTDATFGGS